MKKVIKQARQLVELRNLTNNKHVYECYIAKDKSPVLQLAKKLHASVYLDLGFINQSDITDDGVISEAIDPHQHHSTYFVVADKSMGNGKPIAVARQIESRKNLGLQSFPLFMKTTISKAYLSELNSYSADEIVEISALVKAPKASSLAPLILYKFMLDHSLKDRKHKVWVMALDSNVYTKMKYHFGNILVEIGDLTALPGGDAVPIMMRTDGIYTLMEGEIKGSKYMQKQSRRLLLNFFNTDVNFGAKNR